MTQQPNLLALVSQLTKARVLVVGDVMVDHFHYGEVNRISPEAPIPVLKVERENTMLGGAGNVVRNLRSLSAKTRFLTITGKDPAGREVTRMIKKQGVKDTPIIDDERPTSTKTRFIAGGQQILRADREKTKGLTPNIETKLVNAVAAALKGCQVVVLSDYGKGTLTTKTTKQIIRLAVKEKKIIIVDPKGTDFSRYSGATFLTPNQRELATAVGFGIKTNKDVLRASKKLIKSHNFGAILTTRSSEGMSVVTADGIVAHLDAEAKEVFDVSGAGDTVVATFAAALAAGSNLDRATVLANTAAGIVVGKVGTASVSSKDLLIALHNRELVDAESKVKKLNPLKDQIDQWRKSGLIIGFTNGCFDLLHPGHIFLLEQASKLCDCLVVGLNSDKSVKALKGEGRPIQSESSRAIVLASLNSVNAVIVFSEHTPLNLIKSIKPDLIFKGSDYSMDSVVGASHVKKYGGKVKLVKLKPGHSTSKTIKKMSAVHYTKKLN
ncbi:MAG: D-glycero-beta-D-manno-heptose-7-phosphate kinase [Pseudomonadota bacterium]|nr:D-glycero-beta-D-manno-heptose-7-phosphate kinase [Pseudomonadota bacterium]